MSSHEPGRWSLFVGAIVLAILMFVGLVMIELLVDVPYRKTATQLVTAVVLGVAVLKIRSRVGARLERQAGSAFDGPHEQHWAPGPDRMRFHQLHDDVRFALRSHRHFDLVVWPRLVRLARPTDDAPLRKPPGRSFGRGPSVERLADVVTEIEACR